MFCHLNIFSLARCVTDAREWRYFKQLNQIQSPMEEGMFTKDRKSHFPEVFLRPKETVHIPFKYLSFVADQTASPQVIGSSFKPILFISHQLRNKFELAALDDCFLGDN